MMINLSFDELRLIAQLWNISDCKNKSKEDLIKALSESELETLKPEIPKSEISKPEISKPETKTKPHTPKPEKKSKPKTPRTRKIPKQTKLEPELEPKIRVKSDKRN